MQNPARLFQALADETRLKALALIHRHGELCVCDVMNVLGITQSKASRHLRYLLNAGLLKDRRETIWAYYRMPDDLSSEQHRIIDTLPDLLGKETWTGLERAFTTWMQQKSCKGPCADLSDLPVSTGVNP